MQLLVQNCLDPSRATEIFSVPKRRIFALPKIVRYRNKSGLQYMVQGETKTPNIMGHSKFCIFTRFENGHFWWKIIVRVSVETSNLVRPALHFLIPGKISFSLIVPQRCLAETAKKKKNVWLRAQKSAKITFFRLCFETYLTWKFLFLRSFLSNNPWTFQKNSLLNQLWEHAITKY